MAKGIEEDSMSSEKRTKPFWPVIFAFLAGFSFFIGLMQVGFRINYEATQKRLKREGKSIEAVIKEKEHKVTREKFGDKYRTNTYHWIRYLPVGKEDTKENLLWEDVAEPDFEKFREGQKIHAWILGEEHLIQERSGFHSDCPSWIFFVVGAIGLFVWLFGRRATAL